MRGRTVARPYASALFEIAEQAGELELYGNALGQVARLLDEEPRIRTFLETPQVGAEEKKEVLREAFQESLPGPLLNFLFLVVDRRRQRFLRAMDAEYRRLLDERMGRTHVEVSAARSLGEEELEEIRSRLTGILGKEAIPHVEVRPELLGGIIFKSEDLIYDGSLRRRLDRMKQRLLAADI